MQYDIIVLLILNSLYIFGFSNATYYSLERINCDGGLYPKVCDREILWRFSWYLRNAPKWIKNPVFDCVVCMASIHSWPYLLFNHELTILNGATYIIYIFALSGFNKFVNDRVSD